MRDDISFGERKLPTWQLAILGIIFIGGGFVAPMIQMQQSSEHAEKWNAYVHDIEPLLLVQDEMLNQMSLEPDGRRLSIFVEEAERLHRDINAIDIENEELEYIHNTMERRAALLLEALQVLDKANDPNSAEAQEKIQRLLREAKDMLRQFDERRDQYAKKYKFQIIESTDN